jgi:hypothetical protein
MAGSIFVGRVHYVDFDRDFIPEANTLSPFVHKRRSFEFEHEVRACIQDVPVVEDPGSEDGGRLDMNAHSPLGRAVAVDLDILVEAIYVSPIAPLWLSDLVQSVCARYGLGKPIEASTLAARPVY